jgi:NADH dehydrogenase
LGGVHISFLIGFRHRVQVLLNWFWHWLLNARDARLITGDAQVDIHVPRSSGFVPDRADPPPTESTAAGSD